MSFSVYLTFKFTGRLVFYLATVLLGEVENIHSYPQNNFKDMKVSSDQTLSQPDVWNPFASNQSSSLYSEIQCLVCPHPLEWAHELHLFTLKALVKAGFEEYTQESTDDRRDGQERTLLRKWRTREEKCKVAWGASPFFSVRLHYKQVSVLRLLNRLMASLSNLEGNMLAPSPQ